MDNTTIAISPKTRKTLNIIKAAHGFESYDDLIVDMIGKQYGETLSISLCGDEDVADSDATE